MLRDCADRELNSYMSPLQKLLTLDDFNLYFFKKIFFFSTLAKICSGRQWEVDLLVVSLAVYEIKVSNMF